MQMYALYEQISGYFSARIQSENPLFLVLILQLETCRRVDLGWLLMRMVQM